MPSAERLRQRRAKLIDRIVPFQPPAGLFGIEPLDRRRRPPTGTMRIKRIGPFGKGASSGRGPREPPAARYAIPPPEARPRSPPSCKKKVDGRFGESGP